jgi:hypothetical protein
MKICEGVEVIASCILNLNINGSEGSASHSSHFTPVLTGQDAGWTPEPVWIWWGRQKNPCPSWKSNPSHPAHSLVTALTQLPQLFTITTIQKYTSHTAEKAMLNNPKIIQLRFMPLKTITNPVIP